MTAQEKTDVTIIKKYANRRLYNTSTSSYITLEDLYEMIKINEDFVVTDAKTGEDLTRTILTQIIFEQESKGYNLLPISFLKSLIALYGNSNMGKAVPEFLNISMQQFMENQDKFSQFNNNWEEYNPVKIMENMTRQNMEIFDATMKIFTKRYDDDK